VTPEGALAISGLGDMVTDHTQWRRNRAFSSWGFRAGQHKHRARK